jgi:hypothetical protein
LADAVRRADNRDLVIRVTWQGEADVDLQVLEPLGTVCSAQNRMTPAGGVLVNDAFGRDPGTDKNPAELYVCARALPGPYEIRLQEVWGSPSGGRVKVEVIYQQGNPVEKHESHYVNLGSAKPLVVRLESGRRTQLLAIPQLVPPPRTVAEARSPVQQLRALALSDAGGHFQGPQALFQFGGVGGAVARGGAVAFQPTIEQFFFGAGLSVSATVTADRRYVRLNLAPFFNALARVEVFKVPAAVGGGGGF